MVPRRGLEPPRLSPLVPETSASTNSATWATSKASVFETAHTLRQRRSFTAVLASRQLLNERVFGKSGGGSTGVVRSLFCKVEDDCLSCSVALMCAALNGAFLRNRFMICECVTMRCLLDAVTESVNHLRLSLLGPLGCGGPSRVRRPL